MRLLVAGEDRVDAGKTTFSVGLLSFLRAAGRDPIGFKPRAGNDFWFDHDDVLAATAESRLYGKDAARLAGASTGDHAPESLNPVHRLWRPTPGDSGVLGESDRTFLVDRLRTPDGTDRFVVNDGATLPERVREALPLSDATRVDSIEALNEMTREAYLPAFEALAEEIRRSDTAVVESYGDIARPLSDLRVDAVATVAPGRVRVWDGERYARACEVASGSAREGQLEEHVGRVTGMLDPLATVELPALGSDGRADPAAVADAYREGLAALVDAA